MSAITQDYIDVSQLEAEALSKSLGVYLNDSIYDILSITGQAVAMCITAKSLLNAFLKEMDAINGLIDDSIINKVTHTQNIVKHLYQKINRLIADNHLNLIKKILFYCSRWLLRKTFNYFALIITHITEHNVDIEDSYSASFSSVNDLISHLNS